MVFSSTVFLFIFLPAVLVIYYNPFIKGRRFKNVFLLLASLGFYAWGEPVFVFLMIVSVVFTWYLGKILEKTRRKSVLIVGVCWHVAVLFVFKYLAFAAYELGRVLKMDLSMIKIALPVGLSFFTFQLMSYLFDVYYKTAQAQANPLYVGLYVAMFPQLIAGPIVRYKTVAEQIVAREESLEKISVGMRRFIYGLGKKVLIANYVSKVADGIFSFPGNRSAMTAWLGAAAYSFQIYFDFSGYSDMAIGLGKMFGFDFSENFNYPYISKSITEFWRRWHISLGSWFRDYVYIPLGGSRVKRSRWILNLFIVWLLTGIWHGANWTFVLWGMIYFAALLAEKTFGPADKPGIFSRLYTGVVVMFAWVVFRADSVSAAASYMGNMLGIGGGFCDVYLIEHLSCAGVLLGAAAGATPLFRKCCVLLERKSLGWIEQLWLFGVFMASIAAVVSTTYNPFIYFNF